ncbi:hypothetical protein M2140_001166 [Clostridiales Family XIII bacterium PM5-7]
MERKPKIAILRWEEGHVPEGLLQLETMPGNSTNEQSYPFPVRLIHVEGACVETIITNPSPVILQRMIDLANKMVEEEGIKAISTSCGFNAIFQKELETKVAAPVFTSSLLQAPFIQNIIGADKAVGVITANKASLTEEHFAACGIGEDVNLVVMGLEEAKEWSKIFDAPDEQFDVDKVTEEILAVARKGVEEHPEIGAILLECTDLPPFAEKIRQAVDLPVFDFISMMGHVAMSLGDLKIY